MITKEIKIETRHRPVDFRVELFVCSDGKKFKNEIDAQEHEVLLEKIKDIPHSGSGFYCKTKEELINVAVYSNKTDGYRYSDGYNGGWEIYGNLFEKPDWYIFSWEENCNGRDYYSIETASALIKEAERDLDNLKTKYCEVK